MREFAESLGNLSNDKTRYIVDTYINRKMKKKLLFIYCCIYFIYIYIYTLFFKVVRLKPISPPLKSMDIVGEN